ncbi:hypothetical protein H1S01_09170 [Heliobacterium chlorum]|uniref:Uncharacterized protein n=1 Tax=Heliobacterium chlorum TaxID=2698 RepID=A0ABR7T2V9_HELCL|nr:hypothetical protein [Heliobacterium chlorum]MBC9784680.1 hypothetical protein [Heliobacterium chlorum]
MDKALTEGSALAATESRAGTMTQVSAETCVLLENGKFFRLKEGVPLY